MTNDVKVLNGLVAICPAITIWSGKRKMRFEDYGISRDELPPTEISDLGAKKLCPPEKMRIFLALKARCVSLLDRHGIKFIASSWLVPKDKVKEITDELTGIKEEFLKEKAAFLSSYNTTVNDWIAKHPQWESMLSNAVPPLDYVSSKLCFDWKSFRFSMSRESNIAGDVANLASSIFTDIARQASDAYRDVFEGRLQITQKSLGPLRTLEAKLHGLSFVEPRVAHAATLIHTALGALPAKGTIEGNDLSRILGLVCLLRDPAVLEDYTTRMMNGQSAAGILAGVFAPLPVPQESAPIPTAIPAIQPTRIASQGLW